MTALGSITLVGDRELIAKFESMSDKVHSSLLRAVYRLALKLEAKVKNDKLSGQVLNHRSGRLWQSIHNEVEDRGDSVIGSVFSSGDIKYASLHEYGETIREHSRLVTMVFGRRPKFPVYATVKEFTMPERSFMRTSLKDMEEEIVSGLTAAVTEGTK